MFMKNVGFSKLVEEAKRAAHKMGYSGSIMQNFENAWKAFSNHCLKQGIDAFSVESVGKYVLETFRRYGAGYISKRWYNNVYRSTDMLVQYYETGKIIWKNPMSRRNIHLDGTYLPIVSRYISELKRANYADETLRKRKMQVERFFLYLDENGIRSMGELSLSDINTYVVHMAKSLATSSMVSEVSSLRVLFSFAYSECLTKIDLAKSLPHRFGKRTTAVISTITGDEQKKLLLAVDRKTDIGKRDYAVILLALRLGLRAGDICNLKFENINWKISSLEIVQHKTTQRLVLPLLPDVGNAIADYMLTARPESSTPYVFLRSLTPFIKMNGAVYKIVSKHMKKAGIHQDSNARKGPHCLRHSAAANLLAAETPLPVISNILGHTQKESTKVYLSTDLEHLRSCALRLDGIAVAKEGL